ncbi:reverse transcriptase domain-containing protein, partial [Tanacetum coccineum]
VLLNMSQAKAVSREKEKGVVFKDIKETERFRPTSTRSLLTLKPLPKIDPKDKGKKKSEEEDESESESDGIPEAERKFKQLASDEEMARKVQEEWEGKEERKRLAEEEATNEALIRNYDDIKARIKASRLLAERLQEQEREQFTHVGNFKHSDLKTKKFEKIQALYEKIKRSDEDFISIRFVEDERLIKKMNEKGIDSSKNENVKEEGKEEEGTKKRMSGQIKMIARKKPRKQSDDDSDDEHRKCMKIVIFESILDSEIMEKKSVIARLNKLVELVFWSCIALDGDMIMLLKAMSEARMREVIREQVTASMAEFMANMNRGAGGDETGGAGAGGAGAGGAGAGGAGAGGAGVGGVRLAALEITGCTYVTFMKCDPQPFKGTKGAVGLCRALTWWNGRIASMGIDAANGTLWTEVRKWMTKEFCPRSVLQRLEQELYNLKLKWTDIDGYTNRFYELALLCPRMVEPEKVKVEQYIRGLSKNIRGDVTSSRPAGIDESVRMAYQLMGQIIQDKTD